MTENAAEIGFTLGRFPKDCIWKLPFELKDPSGMSTGLNRLQEFAP